MTARAGGDHKKISERADTQPSDAVEIPVCGYRFLYGDRGNPRKSSNNRAPPARQGSANRPEPTADSAVLDVR
jgi:hypothetical protein